MDAHANLAVSVVAVPPVPAMSGLSLTVATGQGVRFPAPPFNATVSPPGVAADASNAEIVRVTGVAGDVLTFTRRAEAGAGSRAILFGDRIAATVTVKTLTDVESAITSNATAVAAETARATTVEATLTAAVTSEASTRASGDTANANAITAETSRATSAESTLTTNLAAEATARASAVSAEASARATAVTAEASARATAVTNAQAAAIGAAAGLAYFGS